MFDWIQREEAITVTAHDLQTPITGKAAGVPYVALPPADGAETAPLVLTWHLGAPPRSETAMAAALPLRGLEAWRVYLGLPVLGSRLPEGGLDELRQALSRRSPERTSLVTIPGMGHALADEPGLEPAPQTVHASQVDAATVDWFRRHLRRHAIHDES